MKGAVADARYAKRLGYRMKSLVDAQPARPMNAVFTPTAAELTKAQAQLFARLVFEADSVTNVAHQLGYFETIGSLDVFQEAPARIAKVTVEDIAAAARRILAASNRTVGYFDPVPVA